MASFREAFTKEQKQLLNYDDNAALYFAGTLTVCILLPWGFIFFKHLFFPYKSHKAQKLFAINGFNSRIKACNCTECTEILHERRCNATSFRKRLCQWKTIIQFIGIMILVFFLYMISQKLATVSEIQAFNPFEILNVDIGASERLIRKAYRVLSLTHHPDKNPNDQFASAKFILITKAYQSLTDETSRKNYEKYGNPDGPGLMEIGIGLPQFLIDEENQGFFLALFLILVIFAIPLGFIFYYQKQKNFYPNGVRVETIQFLGSYLTENTSVKNTLEFLAASAESRDMTIRASDEKAMVELEKKIPKQKKLQFNSPLISRNLFLLIGHMYRFDNILTSDLKKDLDTLLTLSTLLTESMIEIAFIHNWSLVIRNSIEMRRCLVQRLTPNSSPFIQIPHYSKLPPAQKREFTNLNDFVETNLKNNQTLSGLSSTQQMDVNAFCATLPRLSITYNVFVAGESEIVEGDVVTLSVCLTRNNLLPNQVAGPVHAPRFPELKYEEWWLFLHDKKSGTLMSYARCKDTEHSFIQEMRFIFPRHGLWNLELLAMCDSYSGIDVSIDVPIKVLSQNEVAREVILHPEDAALDNEPTMFQQILGQVHDEGDDSDIEEENIRPVSDYSQ